MTYQQLSQHLNNNHFYPEVTTNLETDEIENLFIQTSTNRAVDQLARINEILNEIPGTPFAAKFHGETMQIHIKQKMK